MLSKDRNNSWLHDDDYYWLVSSAIERVIYFVPIAVINIAVLSIKTIK